jgi:hypothetical protein
MFSRLESVAGYLVFDLLGSLVRFPVWWYGQGLHDVIEWAKDGLVYRWRNYALKLWLKNILVPMYGQYDLTGRLVSVFMRLVIVIARFVAWFAEFLVYVFVLFVWLAAPVGFVVMLLLNLFQGAFVSRVVYLVP